MVQEDSLNAAVAHAVLALSSANGLSKTTSRMYQYIGTHANLLIHSVVGTLHFQIKDNCCDSGGFSSCLRQAILSACGSIGKDFDNVYRVTHSASKYLPLAFLNADLYRNNQSLSYAHLASGIVPFVLSLCNPNGCMDQVGNLFVVINIISLLYFSIDHEREYGYYTGVTAILTYCSTIFDSPRFFYPLGLALMDFFAVNVRGPV